MRRLLAVIGGDVSASLSPLIHGAAAQALGLDLAYIPVNAPTPGDFEGGTFGAANLGGHRLQRHHSL
jgi:shikimate 5-dehydrogenase